MASVPKTHKRLMVHKLTSNFREAVKTETADVCKPKKGEVCIKNKYVGINATDVNMTKGRYFVSGKVPFGVGLEGIGEVAEVGEGVEHLKVGQTVAYINGNSNSYAEYSCVPAMGTFPVPDTKPEYIALLVSGLTASISLDKCGRIVAGETVLITAAAGGTGHIAVQWAKAAECHVIGTCSTPEKEKLLKELGCDRVINYKTENLDEVLTKEYKEGVNVVWETIGGEVFQTCLKHLSIKGRMVVVGGISGYKTEDQQMKWNAELSTLPAQLLTKSTAVQGFLLTHYMDCFPTYYKYLSEHLQSGKLRIVIDTGSKTADGEFLGMEGIIRGVEHLHSAKNSGKVIARIS
ncbi:prostaglandin reductase 3 [Parasteatoda tepidariorum]|uniref:prostaglandin reductase 3 n=1 Tax=Parasteatoda tepidariorum TaxID=114398 RepID=UPI001C724E68|nr:prostaglandin reductase 3 [Parasteatoda tepidariorum]